MSDPRLFRLRVMYAKRGRLCMLSHLEVARALERTVRRAGLPFAVSNGFSPHMRIAFGAALPVGVGGAAEFFDLFLQEYVAPQKALEALRASSAPDLMPFKADYIEAGALAASVACPVSTYEVQLNQEVDELMVPACIEVVRKKKARMLDVAEFLVAPVEIDGDTARFILHAKPSGSLRPDVFMQACIAKTCAEGTARPDLRAVSLTRIAQDSEDAFV